MTPPPIVCTVAAAHALGAWPYAEVPLGMRSEDANAYCTRQAQRITAKGLMPIFTHGSKTVFAMPFHQDAWRSGSRP